MLEAVFALQAALFGLLAVTHFVCLLWASRALWRGFHVALGIVAIMLTLVALAALYGVSGGSGS